MEKGLKVLLVASESAPFVKSGGLGDVVGSLPKALQKKNVDVRVVIPRHRVIKNETMYGVEFLGEFDVLKTIIISAVVRYTALMTITNALPFSARLFWICWQCLIFILM